MPPIRCNRHAPRLAGLFYWEFRSVRGRTGVRWGLVPAAKKGWIMAEEFTTQRLLALRKLTRALADLLRGQAKDYLATLGPLFRPRSILGGYTETNPKETVP